VVEEAKAAHDAIDDMQHATIARHVNVRDDERHRPHLQRLCRPATLVDLHVVGLLADGGDAARAKQFLATAEAEEGSEGGAQGELMAATRRERGGRTAGRRDGGRSEDRERGKTTRGKQTKSTRREEMAARGI
jgi:hypothetical protein